MTAKKPPRSRHSFIRIGSLGLGKIGVSRFDIGDPYHLALTVKWPSFVAGVFLLYVAINVLFAFLYELSPDAIGNAHPGSVADAYFFSMETLATVGYGQMYPATRYGHIISATEIMTGMAFTALVTGLIFVRFSKPRPKILYADRLVVTTFNGQPTLMIRIGNGRTNMLTDMNLKLSALMWEDTHEGQRYRRLNDLKLHRSHIPMFALTLTAMHTIDEHSPLAGHDAESVKSDDVRLFLSIEARDSAIASTVHDLKDYTGEQILYGMRYADTVHTDEHGRHLADMTRISHVEDDGICIIPPRRKETEQRHAS
jgi:inward rectifier potassium channel